MEEMTGDMENEMEPIESMFRVKLLGGSEYTI